MPSLAQAGSAPVLLQLFLCRSKTVRHRPALEPARTPFLWIGCNWCITAPGFRWPPMRRARPSFLPPRYHVRLSVGGSTLIRRVLENVPHGLAGPNLLSSRGQLASFLQPTTYFR